MSRITRTMDPVEIDGCKCIKASDLAILVRVQDDLEVWIPQSLIHDDSEVWEEGDEGVLIIPEWFASQRGLI